MQFFCIPNSRIAVSLGKGLSNEAVSSYHLGGISITARGCEKSPHSTASDLDKNGGRFYRIVEKNYIFLLVSLKS